MSFDTDKAVKDPAFWKRFTKKYGKTLQKQRWQGPLEPEQLKIDANSDLFEDVFLNAVQIDGKEKFVAESDGGGIPGSGDVVFIKALCGKFFITGSCMSGGPYETLEEATDRAGLNG